MNGRFVNRPYEGNEGRGQSSPQVDKWDMSHPSRRGRVSVPRPFGKCRGLHRTKAPSDEGKRSAVAVVNGCPGDSQSRDRAARRRLDFAKQKPGGENNLQFSLPPPALRAATSLIRGRHWLGANPEEGMGCGGDREVSGGHWPPVIYDHHRMRMKGIWLFLS